MALLTIEGVSKRFGGDAPAVRDFSLTIEQGSFLALLGPSGCGKTTLLRMIAGFARPDAGSIRLGERLLAGPENFTPPEQRNMAMVFQSYALWPHMTVAQNVGYPLKVRRTEDATARRIVGEALDAVQLEGMAGRYPAELSGGQRQRVALARCLVTSPEVILLDEPLANLDRHLRHAMEGTFREFHRRTGATMIYVTHDQSEAMSLADQVAVMSAGQLLQHGRPADVYTRPADRQVAALVGSGAIVELPVGDAPHRDLEESLAAAGLAGRDGPPAQVLIRPEDVIADPYGTAFTVTECVFRGERHALSLVHEGGARLQAYAAASHAAGETVRFRVLRGWRL